MKMKQYCEETSLHGFKYLTQTSKFQLLFWYLICTICIFLSVLFIYFQMVRYQHNRVTTSIATTHFPVWKVPFPAVSICNLNVVRKSHTAEFIDILERYKLSKNIIEEYFHNLSVTILNNELSETDINLDDSILITHILEREGYNTERLMDKLAQPCSAMLRKCKWKATEVDCNKIFKKTKTTGGFCCSYNYQGVYTRNNTNEERDTFAGGIGSLYGLKIYLDVEASEYLSTKTNLGFRVLVQNPFEYPDVWIYGADLDIENKISIAVKPMILSSAEELRSIDVKSRGCLFNDERKMHWSNHYTVGTCLKTCKLQVIWKMCKCIPFYYPVSDSKFCTILDSSCVINAETKFINMRVGNQDEDQLNGQFVCNCPSACDEITYSSTIQVEHMFSGDIAATDNDNLSVVSVFFGTSGIIQFTRNEFITWDTLLASIGGIFGLFLGGSIMSIIELIFHVISWIMDCRKTCNISRKNKIGKYHGNLYISELYPRGLEYYHHMMPVMNSKFQTLGNDQKMMPVNH